ncbi:MAG: YdcF family protein [Rhodospirillales bacterium]|nr:YdcF family protein [Rhodospirillales bacterium]
MATIVFVSLLNFVGQIPKSALKNDEQTDVIVVLTGGSSRLEEGIKLLAQRKAKKLFVSGVYRGVDVRRLLSLSQRTPDDLVCCIEIGHTATSTKGNATETKLWMDQEGYQSLRLVTASYHMPRSISEFQHHMPQVRLVPHAVFPAQFKRQQWWRWPGTASLILTEYAKYLMSSVRQTWETVNTQTAS